MGWILMAIMEVGFTRTTNTRMELGSCLRLTEMARWKIAGTDWQTLVRQGIDDRMLV